MGILNHSWGFFRNACLVLCILLAACSTDPQTGFVALSSEKTGIHFKNEITESETLNILNFHYIYNGGGVGVGDFDQNGLPDLVFSGNQLPSKLYLNQGNFRFEDISQASHFQPKGWATGVSIVDINADGWPDIYISVGGFGCGGGCFNQLFIHQGLNEKGIPIFVESAEAYGLEDGDYTQQAAFFDYDLDGDLDVYLLHNVIDSRDKNVPSPKHFIAEEAIDKLLRNEGNGHFSDVSAEMGITFRGYGLGICIQDFNQDRLPDVYIANDFLSDDLLYLNRGYKSGEHQGFEEIAKQVLKHTSYNAMGVDIADVNQDGLADILVLDMLPTYNERHKSMQGFMNYNKFQLALRQGYTPQFVRNTLQMNNGMRNGKILPFSELGYLTGVYRTDWSWAPLLADFDNDGDRDLFVTNGYGKDITDLDFINYSQHRNPFGSKGSQEAELFQKIQQMESVTMPNFMFENKASLQFKDQSRTWIPQEKSISNGAAYADLDNDGDLDLVVNNLNEEAYLLENKIGNENKNNWLMIRLVTDDQNRGAFGTQLKIWVNGNPQYHYHSPVRTYLSCMDSRVHVGLGTASQVDSIHIIWADGSSQMLTKVAANQHLRITKKAQRLVLDPELPYASIFHEEKNKISFRHQENTYQDFDAQPLLMSQHSRQGPCLAAADADKKIGEELFIGGAKGFNGNVFYQKEDGSYRKQELPDQNCEDTDAIFVDIDQDQDLDLYVASGGVEFSENDPAYQDRLYLNDGHGNFEKSAIGLPSGSASCLAACDYDRDGDQDLFVGGRLIPRKYPQTPPSFILTNEQEFFQQDSLWPGMVTDAMWVDVNGDDWQDLVVVGEWMPICLYINEQGKLSEASKIEIPNSSGLWNSMAAADLDQDGDMDFVLGNLGLNSRMQASVEAPLFLYTKDVDQNGSQDPLIGHVDQNAQGKLDIFPLHARDDVMMQIVKAKKRFLTYADFGHVTFEELLQTDLASDDFLRVTCLTTSFLINEGKGKFSLNALPRAAQAAPIQSIVIEDFNRDGLLDLLLAGNDYTAEKNNGWYDAFNGLLLIAKRKWEYEIVSAAQSGFLLPGDARDLCTFEDAKSKKCIVAGQNTDSLLVFGYE